RAGAPRSTSWTRSARSCGRRAFKRWASSWPPRRARSGAGPGGGARWGGAGQYLVDARRAILRPAGFQALGELVAAEAAALGATAVGGITMGADPIACAALAGGGHVEAVFVCKGREGEG